MPRFFTLLEAESQLPEVERNLRRILEGKKDYEEASNGLAQISHRITMAGGMVAPRQEIGRLRQQKNTAAGVIKNSMERLEAIGVLVKDFDTGLVDFPTRYRGEEVYLCWQLGEQGIAFWHPVADGFRGRRPVDSEFLKNHTGDD